jgi:hypothetical protein
MDVGQVETGLGASGNKTHLSELRMQAQFIF